MTKELMRGRRGGHSGAGGVCSYVLVLKRF